VTFDDLELGRQYIVVIEPVAGGSFGVRIEQEIGGATQMPILASFASIPVTEASAAFFDVPELCQLCDDSDALDAYWNHYIDAVGWDWSSESPPAVDNQSTTQSITASLANGTDSMFVVQVFVNMGGSAEGWDRPRFVDGGWYPE